MAHQRDTNVEIMTECHDICLKTLSHCLQQAADMHRRTILRCCSTAPRSAKPALISCSAIPTCTRARARSVPKSASAALNIAKVLPATIRSCGTARKSVGAAPKRVVRWREHWPTAAYGDNVDRVRLSQQIPELRSHFAEYFSALFQIEL